MKYIVAFDVETTGLNPKNDFIIQLVMKKLNSETLETVDERNWYINPIHVYEIAPQAQEKHGLTKEFLSKNGVYLKDIAQDIIDFFEGCDILTYNGNTFDVKFLYYNLQQVGYEFDISNRMFYDAYQMYRKLHPSTLEAVYKHYTGKELEGAHNAYNDVDATIEVFKCLHDVEHMTRQDMENMLENKLQSPEGSIIFKTGTTGASNEDEMIIVFATGKHKDEEFMKICNQDPSYIKWFIDNVATEYTKKTLRDYYKKHKSK